MKPVQFINIIHRAVKFRAKITACQVLNTPARTKEEQLSNVAHQLDIDEHVLIGSNMILFPELSTIGTDQQRKINFSFLNLQADLAEELDGPACQLFKAAAKEYTTWFGFGLPLKGWPYNSFVLVDPEGNYLFCRYMPRSGSPDPSFLNFDLNGVRIVLAICRGIRAPEVEEAIYHIRPDLVVIPADVDSGRLYHHYARKTWGTDAPLY